MVLNNPLAPRKIRENYFLQEADLGHTPFRDRAAAQNYLAADYQRNPEKKPLGEKALDLADRLDQTAAQSVSRAKEGKGALGSLAVDVGTNALQVAADAGISAATMGVVSPLTVMAVRSFGNSALEARRAGASDGQQLAYGLAGAAVEVATEKLFGGNPITEKLYGKGFADGLGEALVQRYSSTAAGRTFLRTAQSALEEGAEEWISDMVNPAIRAIYDNGEALQNSYLTPQGRRDLMADAIYSATVGAALGLTGAAVSLPGTYRQSRADLSQGQTSPASWNSAPARSCTTPRTPTSSPRRPWPTPSAGCSATRA